MDYQESKMAMSCTFYHDYARQEIMKGRIAVVVPTIRPETISVFLEAWQPLFDKHSAEFILVVDGEEPKVVHKFHVSELADEQVVEKTRTELDTENLVSNFCAGVRQLGFLYIAKHLPRVEYIFTTDDDCFPVGDPIQDHIDQLNRRVPISWLSTSINAFMRGFPYGIRDEAPVMLSHGVWDSVPDYDAPTQLLMPKDFKPDYYKGIIPKGIYAPICGMNIMFRRLALPYIYFAPVGTFKGAERWDDIYMGVVAIKKFAELNWAIATGYARVNHLRASNVFTSLAKEAVGIRHGEEFWRNPEGYDADPWFNEFRNKTKKWYDTTYNT